MSAIDRTVNRLSAVPAASRSFPSGLLLDPASAADPLVTIRSIGLKKAVSIASFSHFLVLTVGATLGLRCSIAA